jgi:hypothetical protein
MSGINSSKTFPHPILKPCSWLNKPTHSPAERFIEYSKDIGAGIATLLQLIEFSECDAEEEERALLGENHRNKLLRLAITSALLLEESAEREIFVRNQK